jgi:hypothetical protein
MSDTPLPSLLCRSAVIVGREGARAPHAGRDSRGVVRAAAAQTPQTPVTRGNGGPRHPPREPAFRRAFVAW